MTVVEYGDYECPYCGAAQPVVVQILAQYGDRLRFAYRHFPLVEVHPHAAAAAETAEFAGSRALFWQMHHSIFRNQRRLSIPLLIALATELKLPPIALRDSLAQETFAPRIREHFAGGIRSGVNGTPTFFVNGVRHDSPYGVSDLASAIDRAILAAAG